MRACVRACVRAVFLKIKITWVQYANCILHFRARTVYILVRGKALHPPPSSHTYLNLEGEGKETWRRQKKFHMWLKNEETVMDRAL